MLLLPPCIRPLGFGVLGRRKEEGKEREGSFYICARFSALINGMKLGEEEGGNEEEKCGEKQRTKQGAVKADQTWGKLRSDCEWCTATECTGLG